MSYEEVASHGRKRSLSGEGSHYYQVLGIEKGKTHFQFRISLNIQIGSDPQSIKKAYQKLALKYHPDKNAGNVEAENKMVSISKANSILSDKQKKEIYDQYGSQVNKNI